MGKYSGPGNGSGGSAGSGGARSVGITPADVEGAKFDAVMGEFAALRASLQFQRDRSTSLVRRAILLEIISEIDARVTELRAGEL